MARRTAEVTIAEDGGRDKGKVFVVTEMYAEQAEDWALRALLALTNNGIEIPDELRSGGWASLAAIGLPMIGRLKAEDARPLLKEMMDCVQIKPSANVVRPLTAPDDVEEIATRILLRGEVFAIHTDFSFAEIASKFKSMMAVSAGDS